MKTYGKSALIIVAFVSMLFTMLAMHFFAPANSLGEELVRLGELRAVISERYIGEQDEHALTEAALTATVNALGDPWSRYLNQAQYEEHLRRMGNQQQGLGITFTRYEESDEILILAVTSNSPAYQAGLVAGDILMEIGEYDTRELDDFQVREVVGAHFGQHLRLQLRNTQGEVRTVYAKIGHFYINPVYYEMLEGFIGLVEIINFDSRSGEETIKAIENLYAQGMQALIFDLRYNPGGRVDELLQILDFLLPEGEIFIFEDQGGREIIHYAGADFFSIPMVVMVNGNSFSAAEFFAAILQEEGVAYIVGTQTSGKSRSQQLFPLPSGGSVALSTRRYLTPARVDLYEVGGVQPDFVVEMEDSEGDPQLEKAIELLLG